MAASNPAERRPRISIVVSLGSLTRGLLALVSGHCSMAHNRIQCRQQTDPFIAAGSHSQALVCFKKVAISAVERQS